MEFENILQQLLRQDENRMNLRGEEMKEICIKSEKAEEKAGKDARKCRIRCLKSIIRGAEMGDLLAGTNRMTYTPWQRKARRDSRQVKRSTEVRSGRDWSCHGKTTTP